MTIINRTPEHLRCPMGDCPAVFKLEDGKRLMIVGKTPRIADMEAAPGFSMGSDEHVIVIDRELLGDLVQPRPASAGTQCDHPVAWRFRIGMQNLWSYTETKSDAEFNIKQSGIKKFELQPLFASVPSQGDRTAPQSAREAGEPNHDLSPTDPSHGGKIWHD